jgi:hypothetical protein
MFGFLTKKPYFSKPQRASNPALYVFELFALLLIFSAWLGLSDLRQINAGGPTATSPSNAIAMIGWLGLYGVRLSSWIAIARRNRMPQAAEWLATIVPFTVMILCFLFSGQLVQAYAAGHGYRACGSYHDRETILTFAKPQTACPLKPKASDTQ